MTSVASDTRDQIVQASKVFETVSAAASITTAGAETYTAAQVLGGVIIRDCSGSGRTDTLPTAALLVAAMDNPRIGDAIWVRVINGSDAAETITIAAGTGGDFHALQQATSKDIAQNKTVDILIRITGVLSGSAAYVVYM